VHVHLKSITMKGFKSFPDRTRLDFGPGVSVVVGPNGSGKSNVTDAVLWAMGEQSPLAVRGQSMQDVIFGGGRGVQARTAAEVEIVLDNSDGTVQLPLSEISIVRRLDRSGDGEYRLNGARCRLVDVIEVLSDTGLGKETHSVISQGRVEAIVTSKARDRRMLIEEAAGLGKHRKRRRRAQLKLERTQENLDRALDVEREARTRLRPLKRQAEAAELHERLERQTFEARFELACDGLRGRRVELASAEAQVQSTRAEREQIEARLRAVVERRGLAEKALSDRAEQHEALARRVYDARSGRERLQLRGEQARDTAGRLSERIARVETELGALAALTAGEHEGQDAEAQDTEAVGRHDAQYRIATLEGELAELELEREREKDREVEDLQRTRTQAAAQLLEVEQELSAAQEARTQADARAEQARERLRGAEREVQDARREAARVGAELAAVNQFLRNHASASGSRSAADQAPALGQTLQVQPGFELALAAALGGRLDAALVRDLAGAGLVLDGAGPDGATVLVAGDAVAQAGQAESAAVPIEGSSAGGSPPIAGAQRLLDLLQGPESVVALARRLLADAWVVERLEDLPEDFSGIAATRAGRVWFAAWGEVRQVNAGGAERVLARRNERERLIAASELTAQAEQAAKLAAEQLLEDVRAADAERDAADALLRGVQRRRMEVGEEERRAGWLIEQRREAPEQGPLAVRRAQLEGELAAERRQAERVERERAERLLRLERLRAQHQADATLRPLAERLAVALGATAEAVAARAQELEVQLASERVAGEGMAGELRACASEEAEIQTALRSAGEAVTVAEVAAQRLRDQAAEAQLELGTVAERLAVSVPDDQEIASATPLDAEQVETLSSRLQRLARRREQLGPVNPLAQEEYAEALAHVEELESRRTDMETALRELRAVIRETDRQIHETFHATFTAAARNFEELVGDVFPGGSGRLRLVKEEVAPRPVLGGQQVGEGEGERASTEAAEEAADAEAERDELDDDDLMGVEIEITPAGKSSKRLSLLSGGEKSMTALAFLFAVFLARPCPFYIMDEVEAALDDLNLDRFLALLRRYAGRAQFIVITHQKRTMEAADWLYGVSMGGNGVSKILSRRLPPAESTPESVAPESDGPETAPAPAVARVA
jgi:chromosome segregation protein